VICLLLAGAGSAWAGKNASVEVGFVGVPPPGFQNVLLNVQSVRINPNAGAGPNNGKWSNIPTPPGIGGAQQNAELQIDLNTSQNVPQLFNTANVRQGTYNVAELLLDTTNPGTLIPNCPLAPPVGKTADGCINYPIQVTNGNLISTPVSMLSAQNGKLSQLVLQVSMKITQAPSAAGAPYTVSITLSQVTTPILGTVTGSVTLNTAGGGTGGGSASGKIRKLAVSAEAIGTNTVVATAQVHNNTYTLMLPAAGGPAAPGFGTLYDLAVAGGADSYAAARLPPLYPGASLGPSFSVNPNQTLGNITGTLNDNCSATKPIVGATLQLLVPPGDAATKPPPSIDCSDPAVAPQCITVATANTDNAGNFPLPGTITIPSQFENVPPAPKTNPNGAYGLEITAPGYDPLFMQVKPSSGSGKKSGGSCAPTGSNSFNPCNLAMNSGFIMGTIPIIPPNPGQTALVQVFAEDHGTNTIESALPMPVSVKSSSSGIVGFTLNVPTADQVASYDLYATTIDLYQGVTDPYPGHTIAVKSDVPAPALASGPGLCNTTTTAFALDQTINCIGHGSVTGSVANADLGTSVVLSKVDLDSMPTNNVQIASSMVQNQAPNTGPNNNYAFCVPADTYQVQTVQMPMPSTGVTPSIAPTSEPTTSVPMTVTIPPAPLVGGPTMMPTATATATGGATPTATSTGGPTPTATSTPVIKCPTTCSVQTGACPGICNTVVQPLTAP